MFTRCTPWLALVLGLLAPPLFAADTTTTEPTMLPEGWRLLVRRAPLSYMLAPAETSDVLMPFSGTKRGERRLDIRQNLKSSGLHFSPGAYACLDEPSRTIVAIAPKAEIELLEIIINATYTPALPLVRTQATLVTLDVANSEAFVGGTVESLRHAAGSSWREIGHWSVLGESGQRSVAEDRQSKRPRKKPAATAPQSSGLEVEPSVAEEKNEITLSIAWTRRDPNTEPEEDGLRVTSSFTLKDGRSVVAGIWPGAVAPSAADAKSSVRALIISADLVDRRGQRPAAKPGEAGDRIRGAGGKPRTR